MVLLDGDRKYLGGVEELVCHVRKMVPSFDQGEHDKNDWAGIAREQCEVGVRHRTVYHILCHRVHVAILIPSEVN